MQRIRTSHTYTSITSQPIQKRSVTSARENSHAHPLPKDRLTISDAGRQRQQAANGLTQPPSGVSEDRVTISPAARQHLLASNRQVEDTETQCRIAELQHRDSEVRAHEQAHLAAAGSYAKGGPSYTYQVGPDGKQYAVGGEVPIDLSKVPNDPKATLQKAAAIRRAAHAPADPSAADRAIAAQAAQMATEAQHELTQEVTRAHNGEARHTQGAGETCAASLRYQMAIASYQRPAPGSLLLVTI